VAGLAADVGVAALAFVGTDIDNMLVTMAMVAGAPPERARRIALGQFLGFWIVVGVAAATAAALFEFSPAAVGLLGLVPLAIGIHGLLALRHGGAHADRRTPGSSLTAAFLITVGTSGDNLAAYIPLFRVGGVSRSAVILVVFAVGELLLTAIVLVGGRQPRLRTALIRLGALALPLLYCAVGILVLYDARTLSWVF
jgi:cadmium resistance protein CadD (predicted permease)